MSNQLIMPITAALLERIEAGMFANYPKLLTGTAKQAPIFPGDIAPIPVPATYTLSMEECRAIQSGHPVTVPIATDTLKSIRDGLLAVVAQIEAEEKAKPVMNAIQAMHNAHKSDGRPPLYVDPLRAPDA